LCKEGKEKEFPLFTAVRNVLEGVNKPEDIPDLLEAGPSSQKE
jgi:glycerol-3-phosphate dehydrogenase (NAD+)